MQNVSFGFPLEYASDTATAKRQEDRYARPGDLLADLVRLAEQRNISV